MRLSFVVILLLSFFIAQALHCNDDIHACQVIKAEIIYNYEHLSSAMFLPQKNIIAPLLLTLENGKAALCELIIQNNDMVVKVAAKPMDMVEYCASKQMYVKQGVTLGKVLEIGSAFIMHKKYCAEGEERMIISNVYIGGIADMSPTVTEIKPALEDLKCINRFDFADYLWLKLIPSFSDKNVFALSGCAKNNLRCCRIVKAQKIHEKLTSKGLKKFPWTKFSSHHSLLLTLENDSQVIVELLGDDHNQKDPITSITRSMPDDYCSLENFVVTNGMTVGRLEEYAKTFLAGKIWCLTAHVFGDKEMDVRKFLGYIEKVQTPIDPKCVNCMDLAIYLGSLLVNGNLKDTQLATCS